MGTDRASVEPRRAQVRDAALRRTRGLIAGVAVAAVALSGFLSVVAAQAFKGRTRGAAPTPSSANRTAPDRIPPATDDAQPLQPPAQPPAAADPQSSAAPAPQVSGGS